MDIKDNDRYKMFNRRAAMMSVGGLGVMGTLFGRLYYIQVLEEETYKGLADKNSVRLEKLAPVRGRIYDRFGTELASNQSNFRLVLVPGQTQDIEQALDNLGEVIEVSDGRRERVLKAAKRSRRFSAVTVMENLEWEDFAKVNIRTPDLGGITPEAGVTRDYPFDSDLSHIVGYVAAPNESEIDEDEILSLPGMRIGKDGVERFIEAELRGQSGNRQVEVNAYGRVIRELKREDSTPGKDVILTLDMELQSYAMKRMEGESGAAVVMDIHTGDLLALASVPGFDPNDFNLGLSQDTWDGLRNNKYKPLLNKAIKGQYPPGSTVKTIMALAALEAGVMSPWESVYCGGVTRLGNHDFHCWKDHGPVNMRTAIKESCDVYFYELAQRLGIDRIQSICNRFGLGQVFDFGLPGEKSGVVPSRGWKIANIGEPWQQGETLIAAIGQGFMLANPLQLAVMTARLANGGKAVEPRLIRAVGSEAMDIVAPPSMGFDQSQLQVILDGMNAVSNRAGGTAYGSRIWEKGMELAGKTGTSQVRRITAAERAAGIIKNEDLPWERRDHALFVAFAPVDNPRYAISVFVEHGGGGSKAAAPIARDIMHKTLIKDPSKRRAIGPVAQTMKAPSPATEEG